MQAYFFQVDSNLGLKHFTHDLRLVFGKHDVAIFPTHVEHILDLFILHDEVLLQRHYSLRLLLLNEIGYHVHLIFLELPVHLIDFLV